MPIKTLKLESKQTLYYLPQQEEKPIGLEKFGSSTSNNEYGNNQSCYGKPTTATISTLTTNAATITATATSTNNAAIYRLGHTYIWACKNCKIKADCQTLYANT